MKLVSRAALNAAALFTCLALALAACGSDSDDTTNVESDPDTTEAPTGSSTDEPEPDASTGDAEPDETTDEPASGEGPCAAGAVLGEALPGADFGEPTELTGDHGIQDVEWTSVGCSWESDTAQVRVHVAGPDDFADGFVCAEPLDGVAGADEISPVADLGDQGWFEWDDFQGGKGSLSVCAGERRIDVDVIGPRDGDPIDQETALAAATTIAEALL